MDNFAHYFSASRFDSSGPLNRFLPPVPDGLARSYAAGLGPARAWILDPFGTVPRIAVEMARAGHRVLVTAGNPVGRFLLDLAAHPPRQADLQAALAELAAARKEGRRLETHLQSLYLTRCENCQQELAAEAFLWDAKTGNLTGRIYNCTCGSGGEQPVSPEDVENAAHWAITDGLHRSRVLERVAPGLDLDRTQAEEALNFYLPRAVYALGTIINRLDGLSTSDERRRCMSSLLLYAADCANSLWPHLSERPRPRQLTFPAIYRENNVWMALEAGVKAWASAETSVPLTLWPDEPPESGGLCIFEGPFRDLVPELTGTPFQAVVSAIPRPNQAFWTLSALWSGWLWGHASVGPFRSVLRRRRYDWQWHAEALKALFGNLEGVLPPEIPFLGILAEPEPSFVSAVFLAAQAADLEFSDIIIRGEFEPIQIFWKKVSADVRSKKDQPLDVNYTRSVIRETLSKYQEPMSYLQIYASTLAVMAKKRMLGWSTETISGLEKNIHTALAAPEFIDLDDRSTPETGRWALKIWNRQQTLRGL